MGLHPKSGRIRIKRPLKILDKTRGRARQRRGQDDAAIRGLDRRCFDDLAAWGRALTIHTRAGLAGAVIECGGGNIVLRGGPTDGGAGEDRCDGLVRVLLAVRLVPHDEKQEWHWICCIDWA